MRRNEILSIPNFLFEQKIVVMVKDYVGWDLLTENLGHNKLRFRKIKMEDVHSTLQKKMKETMEELKIAAATEEYIKRNYFLQKQKKRGWKIFQKGKNTKNED